MKDISFYIDEDIDGHGAAFDNWDKNSKDDISGNLNDLINLSDLFTADQIDEPLVIFKN